MELGRLLGGEQFLGGSLAGLNRAVEVALEVDRGVLAGEVAVALGLALDPGEAGVLARLPERVGPLGPGADRADQRGRKADKNGDGRKDEAEGRGKDKPSKGKNK